MAKTNTKIERSFTLTNEDYDYLSALNASESFKRNFLKLAAHFSSLERMYHATETELKGVSSFSSQSASTISKIKDIYKPGYGQNRIANKDVRLISYWDEGYPPSLRMISEPPPLLYVKGDIHYEYELSLAIVGTRRMNRYGAEQARRFGRELGALGFTIISGGATGIDAEAHRGAIESGGNTFAVFGSGIDVCFPANHASLFREISSHGAIISEFPPGTPPEPYRFPIRNRIIAGLARGTLIIQAPSKSGALITAEYALEAGREVMALPGRIDDQFSLGTNQLIRDGARLILDPEDIPALYNLLIEKRQEKRKPLPELDEAGKKILEAMGWESWHVDDLSRESGIPVFILLGTLLKMQMDGYLRDLPGKRYIRISI